MELKPIYVKINFTERYQNLIERHNDFENVIRGNNKELYDQILEKFDYQIKYFRSEKILQD